MNDERIFRFCHADPDIYHHHYYAYDILPRKAVSLLLPRRSTKILTLAGHCRALWAGWWHSRQVVKILVSYWSLPSSYHQWLAGWSVCRFTIPQHSTSRPLKYYYRPYNIISSPAAGLPRKADERAFSKAPSTWLSRTNAAVTVYCVIIWRINHLLNAVEEHQRWKNYHQ